MESSISDIILFVATGSKNCLVCLDFVRQTNFPVKIVRLDTEEARKRVSSGPDIKITSVPSLLLVYEDESAEVYSDSMKIIKIFNMLIKKSRPPTPPLEEGFYDTPAKTKKSHQPKHPARVARKEPPKVEKPTPKIIEAEYSEEEEVESEPESESEEMEIPKGKKAPVVFEEESESEEEVEDIPRAKPQKSGSVMASLFEQAKKLEKERQNTLEKK